MLSWRSLLEEYIGSISYSGRLEGSSSANTCRMEIVFPLPGGDISRKGLSCLVRRKVKCFIMAAYLVGMNFLPCGW